MLTFRIVFRYFCKWMRILKELEILVNYFGDLFKFAVILTVLNKLPMKWKVMHAGDIPAYRCLFLSLMLPTRINQEREWIYIQNSWPTVFEKINISDLHMLIGNVPWLAWPKINLQTKINSVIWNLIWY